MRKVVDKNALKLQQAARLREARAKAGFKGPKEAADAKRWKVDAYKSHENGTRGLKPTVAQKYGEAFGVSGAWILYGGDNLPGGGRDMAHPGVRTDFRTVPQLTPVEAVSMPRAYQSLFAAKRERYAIDSDVSIGPRSFYFEIEDDSMVAKPPRGDESFRVGDLVVFDPDQTPKPGDFVCAHIDGDEAAIFRKYRPRGVINGDVSFELVPLNEDYATELINKTRPGRVIARMVRRISKF